VRRRAEQEKRADGEDLLMAVDLDLDLTVSISPLPFQWCLLHSHHERLCTNSHCASPAEYSSGFLNWT
jgi:hypothetical protein